MFEAQTESFCKRLYRAPAVIFFDCCVMQRFYFTDGSPGLRILPFFDVLVILLHSLALTVLLL